LTAPKVFFSIGKTTKKLDSSLIFLAQKSDLMGEMGYCRHPKTAQVWDILLYICVTAFLVRRRSFGEGGLTENQQFAFPCVGRCVFV
jgi:hypothetical protein